MPDAPPPASPARPAAHEADPSTPLAALDIRQAHDRIRPLIHRTPILTSRHLDGLTGASIFFKCENLQKIGAFKIRGALNAVMSLTDAQAAPGVVTHSSGNHAQALALAARLRSISAHIVMPENAPRVKVDAVRGYGGRIIFCPPTHTAREEAAARVQRETNAHLVHPYNDLRIVAGQATACLELLEDQPGLDYVLAPVGGGGLISGAALAAAFFSPSTRVIGVEPAGADDAARSMISGVIEPSLNPRTLADGLLTSLGSVTFPIIRKHVDRILTVSEPALIGAMRLVWERMKIIIEPSSAVPLAALLEGLLDVKGKKVGLILSGGNADLDNLPWKSA